MKRTFLFQTLLWCIVVGLSLSTFSQQKTRLDGNSFSTANNQNNSQSQFVAPDAATIVRYDDGINDNSIGLTSGGTFEVSARFRPDQLGTLAGQSVTQVEIFINDGVTDVVVKIYGAGTPTVPGPVLYSESHPVIQLSWNLITLTTPVPVDGNDLWVGYEVTHGAGTFPCGLDETPPLDVDGDWIYSAAIGPDWQHLGALGLPGDWNIAAYVEPTGPPCPIDPPTNPSPANGAIDVPVSGNTATWTNGLGTEMTEVYFGEVGSLVMVYDGTPIESFSLAPVEPLSYDTEYGWRIVGKNDTCSVSGPTWTFTTIPDPFLSEWCDEFANLNNWTIVGPLGTGNWSAAASSSAGGTAPELRMSWTPSFTGVSLIRSVTIPLLDNWLTNYSFNFFLDYYADPSGIVIVGITYDGGATSTVLSTYTNPTGNVGPLIVSGSFTTPASGASNAQLEISYDGYSFNTDNVYWDNMCLDWVVPVELTSFTANASEGLVELSWITATETNNSGFEVQRSNGSDFETIEFVEGHGTTTETQVYTYTDRSVNIGTYSYRLKQVDFDGTFEYSNVINADVPAPAVFVLDQNYPNPFNPSTKIAFQLAVDSKVSLKIFDVLGQEVATLVKTNLVAGSHSVNFDASALNSGVYLYRLEASGIDGANFIDVKKMILTK
jgi:hypothetical protein